MSLPNTAPRLEQQLQHEYEFYMGAECIGECGANSLGVLQALSMTRVVEVVNLRFGQGPL